MKSSLIIKLLQELDPEGDMEVSVGNTDIWAIHTNPAYYDGCQKLLVREPADDWHSALKHAMIRSNGNKIVIRPYSLDQVFLDHPNLKVEYDSEYARKNNEADVEKWREEAIQICKEVEEEMRDKK